MAYLEVFLPVSSWDLALDYSYLEVCLGTEYWMPRGLCGQWVLDAQV